MNLLFYVFIAIVIGVACGMVLPRLAMAAGACCLLVYVVTVGACVYREFMLPPHDTSDIGMLSTIETLTILPLGIVLIVVGGMKARS